MSEEINKDQIAPNQNEEAQGEEVKKSFQGLLGTTKQFLSELLDITQNTDQDATRESIVADIPFKGHTSWILICSIFIASIGLNANSTAVVIGAMLISPLMGPILGMGLSLATNDIDTLKRSIKNFTVMVILSILTAFLFFEFFPLRVESSELLARTAPDIRDVLIAFFGGLALVIARAKKGTIASVIFGVAIATALMPPLCTVGFGLAIGNFKYAFGALYLFTINTIFIGLATFLIIKLLRFPMVRYANSQRRRLIARLASLVAIAVMVPAGWTFYNVFNESLFKKQANEFLAETIGIYQFDDGGLYLDNLTKIEYNDGVNPVIEVVCMGDNPIPQSVIDTWRVQKNDISRLKNATLNVNQGGKDSSKEKLDYVNELYEAKKAELLTKDERIKILEQDLFKLSKLASTQIPFSDISAEAKTNYENLASFSYAYTIETNFQKQDTIPVFDVHWKENTKPEQIATDSKKLSDWLKLRLKNNKIQVRTTTK